MTIKQLFDHCSKELSFCDEAKFEATCIFEDLLGVNKSKIFISDYDASYEQIEIVNNSILRRKNGEPLQYILGKWDFYDLTFSVGEGVLIPRPETEILVDFALDKLKNSDNPVVYDLCAGTGCIGLTIAKHRPDAKVFLLEKEDIAYMYLCKNKEYIGLNNAIVIHDDLFTVDLELFEKADIIISNPPYIESAEISGLQKEVLREPITALDGGADGLDFYRCIADRWASMVRPNGYIALECGEEQSESIIDLFKEKYREKQVIFDFNDIDRIVTFRI